MVNLFLVKSVLYHCFHLSQERFYFGDDVLPCFETGIPLLLQRLHELPDADNVYNFENCCFTVKRSNLMILLLYTHN